MSSNNNKRYLAALTKALIKKPRKSSKKELMETSEERSWKQASEIMEGICQEKEAGLLFKQNQQKLAEELKERQEQERLARQIRLAQEQFDGYDDMGIDSDAQSVDEDRLRKYQAADNNKRWAENSERVRDLYIKSFEKCGEAEISTKSVEFKVYECSCGDQRIANLTLYFMASNVRSTLAFFSLLRKIPLKYSNQALQVHSLVRATLAQPIDAWKPSNT